MEYTLKCTVSHGICYYGGVREYEDFVNVDFTPEEVEQIQNVITSEDRRSASEQVEYKLPKIFSKIEKNTFDYKVYTMVVDTCVRWDDGLGGVYEKDLVMEDIRSGEFKPLYKKEGKEDPDTLVISQWFIWLLDKIKNLSYRKRAEYLMKRYKLDLNLDELDFVSSYSFPKELCEVN